MFKCVCVHVYMCVFYTHVYYVHICKYIYIYILLNFRISSPRRHIHVVKFSHTQQLILFVLLCL